MNKVFAVALLCTAAFACNNKPAEKENIDGGACSYKDEIHPAKLLWLETKDSLTYNAYFEIQAGLRGSDKKDTLGFYDLNHQYIPADKIKKDSIQQGNIYQYVVQTIVSGSCNPTNTIFRLTKY